ncbi:MAG: hypothetical protein U9O98_09675, partial [Asgard group archaeon]|nr:hypothetical protein [Asgard group archaeon]
MPTKKEISKKAYTILGKKLYFTQDCLRTKYWCWQNLREQSTYEDNVLKLVLHELSSSSIFVDIGAHFGFYT